MGTGNIPIPTDTLLLDLVVLFSVKVKRGYNGISRPSGVDDVYSPRLCLGIVVPVSC